jgi:hypothetical protein
MGARWQAAALGLCSVAEPNIQMKLAFRIGREAHKAD